jgi:predicted aconitase
MLDGKSGEFVQKSMKILVALGKIYGAKRMLKIKAAHTPGASYRVAGDAGLEYVKEAALQGVTKIPMTLNTGGADAYDKESLEYPDDYYKAQLELNAAYEALGGIATYSCVPYIVGAAPLFGEHVAYGESSAVVFVNSVLGARTNREGGPSALAAAVTGCVPEYGFHLDENRKATYLVEVSYDLKTNRDFAVMGYHIGRIVGKDVPCFTGIAERPSIEDFKALGAALASSGAVALYHVEGFTPEAPTKESVLAGQYRVIRFGREEYAEVVKEFTLSQPADLVVVGCPHCTINEIGEIAKRLEGRKCAVEMWICLPSQVHAIADRMGYVKTITDAGAVLVRDTCPILCPTSSKGFKGVATNSGKLAHYIRGLWNTVSGYAFGGGFRASRHGKG